MRVCLCVSVCVCVHVRARVYIYICACACGVCLNELFIYRCVPYLSFPNRLLDVLSLTGRDPRVLSWRIMDQKHPEHEPNTA